MANRHSFSATERKDVYDKCKGHCAYCGCKIEQKEMQIDHKMAVKCGLILSNEELNSKDNLLPACRQCNFYKSTFFVDQFRDRLIRVLVTNLKKQFIYKLALKYGFVEEHIPERVQFYFERENKDND